MKMKNVQVIDGSQNCTYPIYQFTEKQFALIFPGQNQDIEFASDLTARLSDQDQDTAFEGAWDRPIRKTQAQGIDGTLFYGLDHKKVYYPNKSERDVGGPPHSPVSHLKLWEE